MTRRRKVDLLKQIDQHHRRLAKLKERAARDGFDTEPKTLIEIEDVEAEIEDLQAELGAVGDDPPDLHHILEAIRQSITDLEVSDPRLEMLRRQLLDLSVHVDQLQERTRRLESHEATGLTIARAVAIAAFVVLVVLVSRYI